MTAKIGTIRVERNRAIQGQKDMRKLNRELTRELAASRALCDKHFNTILELRAELENKELCQYPSCQPQAEQQRIAAQVHAELYSGKEVKCEPCNGMGIQDGSGETCKACDGQGKIGYDAIFKAFDERMRDPLQKALYDADLAAKEANAKPSQSVNDLLRVDDYLGRNPGQSSNT